MDAQARQQQNQRGLAANQQQVADRKFDGSFFDRIRDPDISSDVHGWVEEEFPALFSGAQIVGQRGAHFEEQQEFLNRSKRLQYQTENNPGALLQRHRGVHATMEGADHPHEVREPMSSDERRVIRNAIEVATTRQTLSVGARGLKSVTTATSETRTVRHEDSEDDDGMVSKATGVLK